MQGIHGLEAQPCQFVGSLPVARGQVGLSNCPFQQFGYPAPARQIGVSGP
jgi:hypothetical protein